MQLPKTLFCVGLLVTAIVAIVYPMFILLGLLLAVSIYVSSDFLAKKLKLLPRTKQMLQAKPLVRVTVLQNLDDSVKDVLHFRILPERSRGCASPCDVLHFKITGK